MLGHCPNFGKSLLVAARVDLGAPPVCPLVPPQFVHSPLPSFSTGFLSFRISYFFSTARSLIFRVVHATQCAKLVVFSVIGCDKSAVPSYFQIQHKDSKEDEGKRKVIIWLQRRAVTNTEYYWLLVYSEQCEVVI